MFVIVSRSSSSRSISCSPSSSEASAEASAMSTAAEKKPAAPAASSGTSAVHLLLGGFASMMAACCTHPLDLVKVRMQTNATALRAGGSATKPPGMLATALGVIRNEGLGGIYRGLSASLGRQGTYSMTRFGVYDAIKDRVTASRGPGSKMTFSETVLASMFSGALGGVAGTPMDVSMVRMQDDGRLPPERRRNYKNVFNALARVAREEGLMRLYSGLVPNVSRAMFMTAGQIATYDIFKQFLLQETKGLFKDDVVTHFTASTMAGGVATVVTQPIDVLKTRIMAAEPGRYRSALHCLKETVQAEGMLSLYKGFIPSFARLGPQTVLTFLFLEQLRIQYAKLK